MRPIGRIGVVFLGVSLAAAWSFGADAGPKRRGPVRRAPAAQTAPARPMPSGGGAHRMPERAPAAAFHAPRVEPREPQPQFRAPSSDRREQAPSGFHQAPSRPESNLRQVTPMPLTARPRTAAEGSPALTQMRAPKVPPLMHRGGRTFRQEPLLQGNATFMRRTSTDASQAHHGGYQSDGHGHGYGHDSGRNYHQHHWHHRDYWVYVHFWMYDPWFWGFYFAPFPAPWHYTWVWVGAPWYAAWGWYYEPYPYYAGPSYWVTDYTLSRMLEDEYARGYDAGRAQAAGTPITEPVKEQVRAQVDAAAQAFQTEQSIALDAALADPKYLFIVDAPISATTADGGTCALSGGDIIRAEGTNDPAIPVASMGVITSKSESCPAGSVVNVSYTDLQEMLNSFSEAVDDGLHELQNQPTPKAQ